MSSLTRIKQTEKIITTIVQNEIWEDDDDDDKMPSTEFWEKRKILSFDPISP